jgi:hypothetical protein
MDATATHPHDTRPCVTAAIAGLSELGTLNRFARERQCCQSCMDVVIVELTTRRAARDAERRATMPYSIVITRPNGQRDVSYASSREAALTGAMWARAEGWNVEVIEL